jgi:hypothetical protein
MISRPMPEDQPRKQQAQTIEHEIHVQAKRRDPFDPGLDHFAAQHGRGLHGQQHQRKGRDRTGDGGAGGATRTDQKARQQGAEKGQGGNQRKGHREILLP